MFLYLDYTLALTLKQNCPAGARGGKAGREAGSLGGVVGCCASVTLACLMGTYSMYAPLAAVCRGR